MSITEGAVVSVLVAAAALTGPAVATAWAGGSAGAASQGDAAFERSTVEVPAGDVARFELTVPDGATGTINVGSPDVGYVAAVEFEDADGSGNVSVSMNTYLAGRSEGGAEAAWTASDGDRIRSVDLRTEALPDPLDPAAYDVNVTLDGREVDVALLSITAARVTNTTTYTAPGESFGDDDRTLTRTDSIAAEDVLVARVDAPSLRGPIAAAEGDSTTERFQSLVDSDEARFDLQQVDSGEGSAAVDLDLAESIAAGAVTVETSADGTLTLEFAESDLVFENGDNVGKRFAIDIVLDEDSGLTEADPTSSAEFRFTERTGTFETNDEGRVALPASANATVRGTTTVAPGTELDVEARAGGAFLRGDTVTVAGDRSFAAGVDLSDATPGTEFTARVSELDASAPGIVVEQDPTTGTATGVGGTLGGPTTAVGGGGGVDGTATGAVTSSTEPPAVTTAGTPAGEQSTTVEGPGFGVLAGLLGVLLAALLAGRRRRG